MMNKLYFRLFTVAFLSLMAMTHGCKYRGTNVPSVPKFDQGGAWTSGVHVFSPQLRWQFGNTLERMDMWVYIPQVAADPPLGESRPVPLLILLAPQGGDQFYFANHGLEVLLKEMIADGTIQPMLVVCLPSEQAFGGYLFAGGYNFQHPLKVNDSITPTCGNYDNIVGKDLITYIDNITNFRVLDSRQKHGIGGVGNGAYGAFRAALLHDTTFGSITVTDGPLDFDGSSGLGNGLIDLFDDALIEQGVLGAPNPDSAFKAFDSSSSKPISTMFIGGAFAFSPHDTVIYDTNISSNTILFRIDSTDQIDDTVTLISGYFARGNTHRFDFQLPFTSNGTVYSLIWDNFWMSEDLENLLDTATNKLNGVNIWIATSSEAFPNYRQQTLSWINTLTTAPYNYAVTVRNYQGVPGNAATGDQYLYDLLREMLIFHSQSFGN